MTSRSLEEALVRAGLIDKELERERLKGSRDAANAQALSGLGTGLASTLVNAGFKGLDLVDTRAQESAANVAAKSADAKMGEGETAAQAAARVVGEEKDLADPDDPFGKVIEALTGAKKRARESATGAIAGGIAKNAKEKTARDEKTKAGRDALEQAARLKREEIAAANERARLQRQLDEDKASAGYNVDLEKIESAERISKNKANAKGGPKAPDPVKQKREKLLDLQIEAAEEALKKKREQDTKMPDALRKEFNALPQVKEFNAVEVAFEKMRNAAENSSPAGDLTLIYSFMKMQDPTSTVRESEFAAAAQAGSYGEQLQAAAEKVATGERLTDSQRADFLRQARSFFDAQTRAFTRERDRYSQLATQRGVDPDVVVGGARAGGDKQMRFLQRVQELKAQGVSKEQAREILRQENLL